MTDARLTSQYNENLNLSVLSARLQFLHDSIAMQFVTELNPSYRIVINNPCFCCLKQMFQATEWQRST